MQKAVILCIIILLAQANHAFAQGWECEDCPKRNVGLFDLNVMVENPMKDDESYAGNRKYQDWAELFMVAGGIHNALFNDDPSKECLSYYDGQMATILSLDSSNYTHGSNTPSLPPSSGSMEGIDYLVSGSITGELSGGATTITITVQAAGTGETVAQAVIAYDYSVSGLQNGGNAAQQIIPLMEKIRDFEKKKRDQVENVSVGPDGKGATLELTPEKDKIEAGKYMDVTIELLDCDGVPIKNKEVRLIPAGGSFDPEEVTTDEEGKATSKFTAEKTPGAFLQGFEFDFLFPYSNDLNTTGGEATIIIEPLEYDAMITITKRYTKTLETSDENTGNGDSQKHSINESIEASAVIYLDLIETQDMPLFNQTWQYYQPLNVNLGSFNYRSIENIHRSGPDYVTNVDYNRSATKYEIEDKESVSQLPWMLAIDNETGKAVKIVPTGYNIAYEIHETEVLNSVVQTSKGPKKESKTTSKTNDRWFELGPVGEEAPDPTIKRTDNFVEDYLKRQGVELPAGVTIPNVSNEDAVSEIHPDVIVSSGDGKFSFGGSGSHRIPTEYVNGHQEENLSYRWYMTLKKKK